MREGGRDRDGGTERVRGEREGETEMWGLGGGGGGEVDINIGVTAAVYS